MNKYNGNKEFKIDIPKSVKLIIDILEKNGYEAFAVGGCVRDTILDRKPQDWDITTSALPNQVKELFYRTIDTGIQHGTVTVLIKGVCSCRRKFPHRGSPAAQRQEGLESPPPADVGARFGAGADSGGKCPPEAWLGSWPELLISEN